MNWTHLAQVEVPLRTLVATIMNIREFMYGEEFLG
jgi:hypothetical protein